MGSTPEKQILLAGAVIIGLGVAGAIVQKQKLSVVIEGGVVFILLSSLLASISSGLAKVLAALAMLAAVTVAFVELPPILSALNVKAA